MDMSMNIIHNYSQFYRGTEPIKQYGSAIGTQKDTLVKYEFNTTNADGKKVMDKMSKEETLHTMNEISAQYGDNVIVEFSGDGLAALVERRKGQVKVSSEEMQEKQAAFNAEVVQLDKKANYLPEYSGIIDADKAIAGAVQNCSKEEQAFVYDIIRNNFLISNNGSLSEEERQANISLGMKKAEYAAQNFITEDKAKSFMNAMEMVAKLASAGKTDVDGNMDYGVKKGNYLGHGSNLVYTTDGLDMMRTMDSGAYEEYQRISRESSNSDRQFNTLKYLTGWYANAVTKSPHMVDEYEKQSEEYVEKNVKNQKLDKTFTSLKTGSKVAFLESLKIFQTNNPNSLSSIINRELTSKFWGF